MFGIEKLTLEVIELKTTVECLNEKIRALTEDEIKFEDMRMMLRSGLKEFVGEFDKKMSEKVEMLDKLIREYKANSCDKPKEAKKKK